MNKETSKIAAEDDSDQSTWAHDQQKRDYYYDDSHGYEIYNPDEDDEDDEDKSEKSLPTD